MTSERRRAAIRIAGCAFFLFHMGAVTVANVPRAPASWSSVLRRPFDSYVRLAGLWQTWDMFTTIPYFLDLEAELVALGPDGLEGRFGPMLPGLRPYEKHLRIHGLFLRITVPSFDLSEYAQAYFRSACRAITQRTGAEPTRISLDLVATRIRPLDEIRHDQRIADLERRTFEGPACR